MRRVSIADLTSEHHRTRREAGELAVVIADLLVADAKRGALKLPQAIQDVLKQYTDKRKEESQWREQIAVHRERSPW